MLSLDRSLGKYLIETVILGLNTVEFYKLSLNYYSCYYGNRGERFYFILNFFASIKGIFKVLLRYIANAIIKCTF